ncbi:MAG TPA: C25 family cysteine peptidase, partial [Candidatus Krumholzibacterium sp.]|nr:C25 family cysteine peptidase [Candidatus Krumholzibacterium sp.]
SIVDNPESLPLAAAAGSTPSTPLACDYLIVTSEALEPSFVPLRDFYNRRGLKTRILTTEDIDAWFRGRDLCEKVRTAIVHHYSDYGIEYVLLGGDVDVVPYRGFTCTVDSEGELQPDEELPATVRIDNRIPSDIYFSNLDGDWNDDGDILWGEPGEEDLYSEIAVGRACVSTPGEAAIFVHKTTMYQDDPVANQLRRVLLLGENLTNEPMTWGADDLEQLIDTCQAHDYSTTGVPPDFDITTYFDRDIYTWSGIDVVAPEVNTGAHWIFHVGHCNTSYGLRLGIAAVTVLAFTNDGESQNYPVINTIGCLLGSFELSDCIAERMVGIGSFASAMVCNSRFGWFTPGSTNGVSHHYQREFVDAIFGDGVTRLGPAHARSKDDTAVYLTLPGYAEEGVMRWCFYCLNLLGDPAADTWTDIPASIDAVHEGAMEISDATYMVSTG